MADEKKGNGKEKKARRPSALKRDEQSLRRNAKNRSYKAKVSTAIRSLQDSMSKKDAAAAKGKLDDIFSLVDKGVKTGIYKQNKAGRVKSKLSRLVKTSA
ncbi:MAG: 30S ribosomal protein S20 [Parachlamydiales bacterium]|nr:30S ribosomal protein S20 [Verrucomicrobiota bacterium]MBS0651654.1 30S ribosomal protein S20 [Verrucomicrobiota bacterium]MBX3718352.1 30S ribosomal protein S20 [Candidatus Acheromyda pituitae]